VWEELTKMQDPQLKVLVEVLTNTVMKSRADSTMKKYVRAFQRWKQWAASKEEIQVFPIRLTHLAKYLQHLALESQSRAAVEEAVNASSWVHQLAGLAPLGQEPIVKMVVAGLQRELAKPKKKKELITLDMIKQMVDAIGASPTLSDCRLLAIALLAFSAFLRFDEVMKLRCCDVRFLHSHMSVKILSSKTDQYREGDEVVVSRSGSPLCPVVRMEEYYRLAGIDAHSTQFLF
jgi:integrase